jgi:hypothetical protein
MSFIESGETVITNSWLTCTKYLSEDVRHFKVKIVTCILLKTFLPNVYTAIGGRTDIKFPCSCGPAGPLCFVEVPNLISTLHDISSDSNCATMQ